MRTLLAGAALMLTLACASAPDETAEVDAPTALANEVADALGGADRWNTLGGIRWTFGAEVNDTVRSARKHAWAKHTGWHRVDGTTREGTTFCFIHNLDTGEGRAWMGTTEIEGDSLQTLLARAKSMWINDSYWFLMPYKLLDPGVHLALEESVPACWR